MITSFGKELRKLRLDLGITLLDMAKQIQVSSSLLSSMETGRKPVAPTVLNKLAETFPQVAARSEEFMRLADETRSEVRIRLSEDNAQANGFAMAFARKFETLSDQQVRDLMAVLEGKKKE